MYLHPKLIINENQSLMINHYGNYQAELLPLLSYLGPSAALSAPPLRMLPAGCSLPRVGSKASCRIRSMPCKEVNMWHMGAGRCISK